VLTDSYVFQLRAYLYQARGLIPSDDSGLSDPFARVIVSNQCRSTQVRRETMPHKSHEPLEYCIRPQKN